MATPDIGTTISDGYSRGLDRVGPIASFLIVPALVVGAVNAVSAQVQVSVLGDSISDAFSNGLSGDSINGFSDRLIINSVSIVASLITIFISTGALAVVAGAFSRERQTGSFELSGPGGSMSAVIEQMKLLMPRLGLLAAISVVGTGVGILSVILGGLVSFAAFVVWVVLAVRWLYAPVICGSGEATGVAAYERSEQTVEGSWWGTLGTWFVIGLAIFVPVGIGAGILALIAGIIIGPLAAFAMYAILLLVGGALYSSALESGWAQISGVAGGATPPPPAGYAPPVDDAVTPPAAAPPVVPPSTPPTPPATPPAETDQSGPFL